MLISIAYNNKKKRKIMSTLFPYNWTISGAARNIKNALEGILPGLRNVFRWFPIVYFDRWYDWSFLTTVMEFKLRRMAKHFDVHGVAVDAKSQAQKMLICATLLKRINQDTYYELVQSDVLPVKSRYLQWKRADYLKQQDLDYFCRIF